MSDLVFTDIETSGLDRDRHEIVELAWAVGDGPIRVVRPRHTLRFADPVALRINGYHDRDLGGGWSSAEEMSQFILDARGNTIVAANPAFDCGFLQAHFGHAPWHYRLCDIEAWAAGILGLGTPPSLKTIREYVTGLGHQVAVPDHSAAGDVAALRDCYLALQDEQSRTLALRPELSKLVLAR